MKLENQVVSLELAKKLKSLGVKQESLFSWYLYTTEDVVNKIKETWKLKMGSPSKRAITETSAFTVAELGEMLGDEKYSKSLMQAYGHVFNVPDTRFTTVRGVQLCMANPNIGAKMLIYLLENNLITIKQV